jgi:hypothetical protein
MARYFVKHKETFYFTVVLLGYVCFGSFSLVYVIFTQLRGIQISFGIAVIYSNLDVELKSVQITTPKWDS